MHTVRLFGRVRVAQVKTTVYPAQLFHKLSHAEFKRGWYVHLNYGSEVLQTSLFVVLIEQSCFPKEEIGL